MKKSSNVQALINFLGANPGSSWKQLHDALLMHAGKELSSKNRGWGASYFNMRAEDAFGRPLHRYPWWEKRDDGRYYLTVRGLGRFEHLF